MIAEITGRRTMLTLRFPLVARLGRANQRVGSQAKAVVLTLVARNDADDLGNDPKQTLASKAGLYAPFRSGGVSSIRTSVRLDVLDGYDSDTSAYGFVSVYDLRPRLASTSRRLHRAPMRPGR